METFKETVNNENAAATQEAEEENDLFADLNLKTAKTTTTQQQSFSKHQQTPSLPPILPDHPSSVQWDTITKQMEQIEMELSNLYKELNQLSTTQSQLYDNRNEIYRNLIENWQKMKSLETDQANSLTKEDYAIADRLTQKIKELQSFMMQKKNLLSNVDKTLNQLFGKQINLLRKINELNGRLEKELSTQKNQEDEYLRQFKADMENLHTVEDSHINKLREEIEKERSNIHQNSNIVLDLDLWSKEESELNEKIDEKTRDEKLERDLLVNKQEGIKMKILDLLKQIEQLKIEENDFSQQIGAIDKKIESLSQEFNTDRESLAREKFELDKRGIEIENNLRLVDEQENKLHQRLEHYNKQYDSRRLELELLEKHIAEIKINNKIYNEEFIEIEKLVEMLKDRAQRDFDCEKEISNVRKKLEEIDSEVKRLTSKVIQDQQTYSTIQQDITAINTQIPSLEEQKKLAVSDERQKYLELKRSSLGIDQENLRKARENLEHYNLELVEIEEKIGSELREELQEILLQLRSKYDLSVEKNLTILQELLKHEIKGIEYRIENIKLRCGGGVLLSDKQGGVEDKGDLSKENKLMNNHQNQNNLENSLNNKVVNDDDKVRLEELEKRLQEAVGHEDYHLADQIQNEIGKIHENI
ncbi:12950_t:CDS:10 [Entrophospora sp. SA101]|nr:6040_t:CDS:10 [Entrophospora sp. SA101]CAJ0751536.1 12950_t:CDS:10 [Entrophospora sp. SA101]CAJ0830168.1 3718_t:CDS:10 [Entrophospora sp. SA101]